MHFRVESGSPVTFNTKLYVTTVNNSFQPLPIFCHKELHHRCSIDLELNIVTQFPKILEGIKVHPLHYRVLPWENMNNSHRATE